MRKITFTINDEEFFKNEYKNELTEEQWEGVLKGLNPFKAIYTLIGEKQPDRYELTDYDGIKLNYNELNGYQRGVVLNDCMAYFNGKKYCDNANKPCGVIEIVEESI